jgi:putative tricarboxylic transport membrane protein
MKNLFTFDRLVVILTIPIAVFLIIVAYNAPRPNMPQIVGPHVWPIVILSLMIVCAIFLYLQTIREKREALPQAAASAPEMDRKWYRKPEMTGVLTIAGLVLYTALLESVGFIICTSLLVIFQARVIQKGKWVRNISSAVIFSIAIYFAMSKLLMMRLPPGLLDW